MNTKTVDHIVDVLVPQAPENPVLSADELRQRVIQETPEALQPIYSSLDASFHYF